MTVADVMRKEVVTINLDATLKAACRLIFSGQAGGLPVVDKKGKLVGIVVEKDVLCLFFPSCQDYIEDYAHAKDFELMEEAISETLNLPVKKFMSRNPLTVNPETHLMRATALMITKRIRKLPVVDKNKRLVGIISQGDIFRSIVRKRIPSLKGRVRTGFNFFSRLAHHYDRTFSWPQRLSEEIPFLLKYLKKNNAKTVLDLGCGTGEHVIALAKLGFNMTGVDANEDMLANAIEKLAKQKETVRKNIEFLPIPLSDLESLGERRFDAVFCIGNMLPNVLDYEKELPVLKKILSPKATLIIQIKNFDRLMEEKERFINLNFSFSESGDEWEKEYAFLRFYDFRRDGLLDINIETLVSDGKAWRSYGIETNVQKPILKRNLTRLLKTLGFSKIKLLGNYKGEMYDRDKSPFLIAVCNR